MYYVSQAMFSIGYGDCKSNGYTVLMCEAKFMAIGTQSLRPLRPNLKEFKWLRVFGPQCRVLGFLLPWLLPRTTSRNVRVHRLGEKKQVMASRIQQTCLLAIYNATYKIYKISVFPTFKSNALLRWNLSSDNSICRGDEGAHHDLSLW